MSQNWLSSGLVQFYVGHGREETDLSLSSKNIVTKESGMELPTTWRILRCMNMWLQVVLAYGAESDRRLGIPGEVASYVSPPLHSQLEVDY